jgi:methylmalonyl-CoA/ethylmalonyl-CoA epimerase
MSGSEYNAVDLIFDHIGIVVSDVETGSGRLTAILGQLRWTDRFDDVTLGVSVRFARDAAGIVYEIIAPYGDNSPVGRALKSRSDLLNQIAYRTHSLTTSVARLRAAKAVPIGHARPAVAFGGAPVQFLMTELGFLIELIEIDHIVHKFN